MTCLAHARNVAEHVRPTSGGTMDFPLTTQGRITPTRVMVAGSHPAFTSSASPLKYFVSNRHGDLLAADTHILDMKRNLRNTAHKRPTPTRLA